MRPDCTVPLICLRKTARKAFAIWSIKRRNMAQFDAKYARLPHLLCYEIPEKKKLEEKRRT